MKWRALFVPFALLTVALMRLLSPWLLIRVGELWVPRLGHLIGNTECYLYEKEAGLHPKSLDFWYSGGDACNAVIEAKYRRTLHTWPAWWGHLVVKVNEMFPNHKRHVAESAQFDRDIYNLWTRPHIGFTEAEERKGLKLLKELGIEGPWCCLIVRDAAYLGDGYGYHAYRDSDVDTYVLAALELVRRGYTVVRMGAKVAKRFHVKHPKIIDYACEGMRTDFADLYLGAKCALTVGTSTGFISIPHIFHRPILFVNHAPLEYLPSYYSNGALIWKHHERDGKRMTLAEVYASGAGQFTFQHEFDRLGIKVVDNSPQELLEAVEDFLDGNFDESGAFWKDFPLKSRSPYNGAPLHGEVKLKIPRRFGENNSH